MCFLLLGGTTSVSSGTDACESDRMISAWRLLDFHAASKVPVVDTEVDPHQQNSRPIRRRIVSPRQMTKNLLFCMLSVLRGSDRWLLLC